MSERLQGHRTKLNANKMTCDGRCSSRRKQPLPLQAQESSVIPALFQQSDAEPFLLQRDCYALVPFLWSNFILPDPNSDHFHRAGCILDRRHMVLVPCPLWSYSWLCMFPWLWVRRHRWEDLVWMLCLLKPRHLGEVVTTDSLSAISFPFCGLLWSW